jgi:hypothetical protein
MFLPLPFASKELPDGKKLYRRKHGYATTVAESGDTDYTILVPYNAAKINEVEVIGCPVGTAVDFKILDTPSGTISGIANYVLNQFGFDVRVPESFYRDTSPYDADVIKDMGIKVTIKNISGTAFTAYLNVVFHEVK